MLKKLNFLTLLMTVCMGSLVADYSPIDSQTDLQSDIQPDVQFNGQYDGQCDCQSNGKWSVRGEYLYFRPSIDDSYYAITSPINSAFPNGSRKNNDFGFHSGYRVGGAYQFCNCCSELDVVYTNLDITRSKSTRGNFLWATVGRPDFLSEFENYDGFASSRLKLFYRRIDVLYAQCLYECCNLRIGVQFGLEAAYLRLCERYTYQNVGNLGIVRQKEKTSGVGPQVGCTFDYKLFQCGDCNPSVLSFHVCTSGSLLAADTKSRESNVLNTVSFLAVRNRTSYRVIPAFHTRVGLNYDLCFSNSKASIEVGYEFNTYIRALSRTVFPDDVAESMSFNRFDNIDFQGLYVAFNFGF